MRPRTLLFVGISVILAVVFARLGFWQVARLGERRATNMRVTARMRLPPAPIAEVLREGGDVRYRRVRVRGTSDTAREFVLTARTRNGAPGVHFLRPVVVPGVAGVVIVNRGWAYAPDAMTVDRARFAEPDTMAWEGILDSIPNIGGRATAAPGADPRRVPRFDGALLAQRLGATVMPWYVLVTPGPGETPRGDRPVRLNPPALDDGPHLGYAIQWFSFALIAVAGAGIVAARESRSRKGPSSAAAPPGAMP